MDKTDQNKIVLIAGYGTRHIASSAHRAGYRVCAADHFCDFDLGWFADDFTHFDTREDLPSAIQTLASRNQIDHLILASGAESIVYPDLPLAGPDPAIIGRFLDKNEMQHFFEEIAVPQPQLADENEYPVMVKPFVGGGGWRNAIVSTPKEKDAWKEVFNLPYLCQRIVEGTPVSISCISNGKRAVAISTNEQFMRGDERARFGFAGSITPSGHPLADDAMTMAEYIVEKSGLKGSVGVDFLLSDEVIAIEVNPRFQASLDTIERAMGVNLFSLHMDACCRGIVPSERPQPQQVAVRRILFAESDCVVPDDLTRYRSFIADIPYPGTRFEPGNPIVSVMGCGESREAACTILDKHIRIILEHIKPI